MARKWLSPDQYQRLSPAERQRLWRDRQAARRARHRPRGWGSFAPWWGAAIVIGVGVGSVWSRIEQAVAPVPVAQSGNVAAETDVAVATSATSPSERVTFGTCVWGGGTNCVVDGDTFYLHGEKIRIAGIDAPETHDFKCSGEKALGDRATERLRELLNSGPFTLSSIDRDRDVYGRLLRNVAVNGADVGDILIGEQLARAYQGYKMGWC